MATVGPLLQQVLKTLDDAPASERPAVLRVMEATLGLEDGTRLPAFVRRKQPDPAAGESFEEYRDRVTRALDPVNDALSGGRGNAMVLSNGIAATFGIGQFAGLAQLDQIDSLELDPQLNATQMKDASTEIGLPALRAAHPALRGTGVKVAVLDTGIDTSHPFLSVDQSVSTSGEDVSIPGQHGTHCAGALASRDDQFTGIAPDVSLLNVKVLRHNNRGTPTNIARGFDEALALGADIISISLGFNHLPNWSDRGHGWTCQNGDCVLCTAVDNASQFGALVVAAAGNEHHRAEALRRFGAADSFDTELTCPGHARQAIAVGALTKSPHIPAEFSSRGPTAYGETKPVYSCTGVNITSTVPAPRALDGTVLANPPRTDLFATDSGTSMATPIVAGALALLLQDRRDKGLDTSRAAMMEAARTGALKPMGLPETVVGLGRIDLAGFGASG